MPPARARPPSPPTLHSPVPLAIPRTGIVFLLRPVRLAPTRQTAQGGDVRGAIDGLLPLEKKARIVRPPPPPPPPALTACARQASDSKSTSRILEAVVQMCFDAGDWDMLGEYCILLTKVRPARSRRRVGARG